MVSKGNVTTRLNPLRLNTINHLRVRRPNQHEQNACVTVMSSMLSMSFLALENTACVACTIRGGQAYTAYDAQPK